MHSLKVTRLNLISDLVIRALHYFIAVWTGEARPTILTFMTFSYIKIDAI